MDITRNAIGYLRVSTDAQAEEDKFGLAVQKEQIKEYARDHDYRIIKWIEDKGKSGAKTRPGFDEIVYGDITNPPFEVVLVAKSDRVARDINVYFYYKMLLNRKNIELVSISEDFGQFGAFAPMLEAFTMCVAQMERENITKRTSAGRKLKSQKGGYSGGRAPMGYSVKDRKLVVNEKEAELVRFLFDCKDLNYSLRDAADAANRKGFTNRSGGEVTFSNVRSIWDNENTYLGYYRYGKDGRWVKGEHERILPIEEEVD